MNLDINIFKQLTETPFVLKLPVPLAKQAETAAPSNIDLKLVKVTERDDEGYYGVSLIFHGPANAFLPQKTYSFVHETLGELDMFIVPIGELKENHEGKIVRTGFQYQAIFTRLK